MNEKKKLRRLPKRILSFVLTLAMMLTLMPGMSTEIKAETPSNYLTFTAGDAAVKITFNWKSGSNVKYSTDGGSSWTEYTKGTELTLNDGESISFKGRNVVTDELSHFTMSGDGKIYASGSVTSLTDENGGDSSVFLQGECYKNMFLYCRNLVTPPSLPATNLAPGCYCGMFSDCENLEIAPNLPSTVLAVNCYGEMFSNCESLVTAPNLPATTLANGCYFAMFQGCTNLVTAPDLPATTLAMNCYYAMFQGCTNLDTVPDLPATTLAKGCYYMMFAWTGVEIKYCQTEDFAKEWKIPATENVYVYEEGPSAIDEMFMACANAILGDPNPEDGTPELNTVYYIRGAAPHTHGNWTYSVSENVLTATCGNSDCDLTDSKVTLTLTATSANYSGSVVTVCTDGTDDTAAIKYNLSDWNTAGAGAVTVKYVGRDGTTYAESIAAPTKIGKYTIKLYPTSEDADPTHVATADFEITRKTDYDGKLIDFADTNWEYKFFTSGSFTSNVAGDTSGTLEKLKFYNISGATVSYVGASFTATPDSYRSDDELTPSTIAGLISGVANGVGVTCAYNASDHKLTITPIVHTHDWKYSATGNKLEAYCANEDCPSGTDATHKISLTLSASSADYSGSSVIASFEAGEEDAWKAAVGTDKVPTIKYGKKNSDGTYGEATTTAPTYAGTYKASITAIDDTTKTASKEFTISSKTITADFITLEAASKEYTGAEIINSVTVKDGDSTLLADTDYTVTGNKGTAKGSYTVTVTGTGNYTGTATKTWNITGAIPTIDTNPTIGSIIYGQKLSDSTLTGGAAKKGETVVPGTFAWKTPNVTPKVSDSNSTNYTIVFTPTDTENYGTVEFDVQVTVNKKTLTAKILNQTALKTAGATYTVSPNMIVLSGLESSDYGKVSVSAISGGNNPSIASAGTYGLTATGLTLSGEASANYQVTSVTNGTLTVKEPDGGVKINNTDSGSVYVEVNIETDLPTTIISNMDKELASALLSDTDKAYVTSGQNALIYLDLKDGDNLASAEEVSKIAAAVTAGETKVALLDLSLYKKVGSTVAVKISDISSTGKKVEVSIRVSDLGLPTLASGYTRTYSIIRLHGSATERLNATVVNEEIKFSTDKFSLYQILYKDSSNGGGSNPGGGGGYNPTVFATEVKIDTPAKRELTEKGETLQLTANITPGNTTNKSLTWKSSDEAVVIVDSTGKVTAVGDGTATITVATSNGKTATIEITVKNKKDNDEDKPSNQVTAIEIAKNTLSLNTGFKVSQTGKKVNVTWGKVADADGYLVYATYCENSFGSAIKTIKNPDTTSLSITKLNGKSLNLKKKVKVYVKAYKLVDGKKVAFGKTITAHIVGSKNTKYTNVKEIKLTSKNKVTLAVGKTSTIKAKVVLVDTKKKQLSDSHAKEFRYASSDTSIATVDANGKITAKKEGKCTIYVYAKNGYAKKVTVTVK